MSTQSNSIRVPDDGEPGFVKDAGAVSRREQRYIRSRPNCADKSLNNLSGLALSGGGIRSASFALGVMQALARQGVLKKFDYLSTVSGGGYIGSSLSWWMSGKGRESTGKPHYGLADDDFPYRENDEGREPVSILSHLRHHGNYLTPGKGINRMSMVAVLIRGVLLNLIVWVPLLVGAFVAMLRYGHIRAVSDWLQNAMGNWISAGYWDPVSLDGALAAIALLTIFVALSIIYSLLTGLHRGLRDSKNPFRRISRYRARRGFERLVGKLLMLLLAAALFASVPIVAFNLEAWVGAAGGWAAILAGVLSSLSCQASTASTGSAKPRIPVMVKASLGAGLFLYGFALVSYQMARWVIPETTLLHGPWYVLLAAVVIALLTGLFVNLNYISLHRMYRDRLMEAYMPDARNARQDKTAAAKSADGLRLSQVADPHREAPYHIVNANVILVDSENLKWRQRGGDSFILSPYFCGSEATGWEQTATFMSDGMTLPTAMAISGAAANPNAGVGGGGITRNRLVSKLMLLLNLGLGYWCLKPRQRSDLYQRVCGVYKFLPRHFTVGFSGFWRHVLHEKNRYIQLSDGGHFENLALYELIRRKVKLIVACDGGADPEFSFSDLQNALQRIEEDFGVTIDFQFKSFSGADALAQMIPGGKSSYPRGAPHARTGVILGTIHYSEGEPGLLLYLKTTLVAGADLNVLGYRAGHDAFPDQSTADQFFDPAQFEAYRRLGVCIGKSLFGEAVLGDKEAARWQQFISAG